jgi:arylsulfatase A-like enzyme
VLAAACLCLRPAAAADAPSPAAAAGAAAPAAPPVDVVLITVCTLRADRLGAYGYREPVSPSIDALAADGVVFEQPVAPATWTRPSMMSLLTGLLPARHGVTKHGIDVVLPADVVTLAERLRALGYRTGASVSSPDLPRTAGYDRGFEFYSGMRYNPDDLAYSATSYHYKDNINVFRRDSLAAVDHFYDDAIGWLRAGRDRSPFFLWMMDVGQHEYASQQLSGPGFKDCMDAFREKLSFVEPPSEIKPPVPEVRRGRASLTYDASVLCMDGRVGRLLDALRESGLYDKALIVFTADHGEGLGSHGEISHRGPPFDELVRVPLIVKRPRGASAGLRVKEQVRLVDVLPTVLREAGAVPPAGLDGSPLQGFWEGTPDARDACIESDLPHPGYRAVRAHDGWKLMVNRMTGYHAVYRWDRDPGEERDLSGRNPEREGELHETLMRCTVLGP